MLRRALYGAVHHVGVVRAGADAVHSNARAGQFQRQLLREADNAELTYRPAQCVEPIIAHDAPFKRQGE